MVYLGGTIGDDEVGGIDSVDESRGQVNGTSTSVGHLLLGPAKTENQKYNKKKYESIIKLVLNQK